MTKLLGVIGDPISHSLSPLIHNGWLRDFGFPATYEAMHVPGGQLSSALESLAKRDTVGVNVTLPHKLEALALAKTASASAAKIGAANTLTQQQDKSWTADNTDAPGFMSSLRDALQTNDLSKEKVLLLGAGGSARAVVYALNEQAIDLTILNRTPSKAVSLSNEFTNAKAAFGDLSQYKEYIESATIVINTTSGGYSGDIIDTGPGNGRLFYDISYGAAAKAQLDDAKLNGWRVRDGLNMLVAQAAESFRIWFGEEPDRILALKRCQNALEAAE